MTSKLIPLLLALGLTASVQAGDNPFVSGSGMMLAAADTGTPPKAGGKKPPALDKQKIGGKCGGMDPAAGRKCGGMDPAMGRKCGGLDPAMGRKCGGLMPDKAPAK